MKQYITPIGVVVQRAEIDKIKNVIKQSDNKSYQEMFNLIINPITVERALMVPGTKLYYSLAGISGKIGIVALIAGVVVLFYQMWLVSIVCFLSWWFVWVKLQKAFNYEIGARLFALDQALEKQSDKISNAT
ncbi:MAG: hypothetical protein WDA22_15295 [Bacteroidota bacterium]